MARYIDADALIRDINNSADLGGALGKVVECVKIYAKFMVQTAPTIEPQRWIPVDEGMPKDGTDCLVTYSNGFVKIATFAEDLYEFDEYDFHDKRGVAGWCYFDDEYGYQEYSDVIAWMPLPEPYKEET